MMQTDDKNTIAMSDADINLSGINLTSNANERDRADAGIHKTTIIIIVGIFVVAVLGGGYFYYRNVYQPKIYTRALVPLYESAGLLGSGGAPMSAARDAPLEPRDYTGAAERIAARARALIAARAGILNITPPNAALAEFQAALLDVFDLVSRAQAEAEERAKFFAKLLALKTELGALQETLATQVQQQNIRTVGDLRDAWVPHLIKAKMVGTDAFSEKIRSWGKNDEPIAEVTTLWDEVAPDIDFLVELFTSLQAETRLEELNPSSRIITPAQNARAEKGFKSIEKLTVLIDALTAARSASTMLDISASSGDGGIVLSEKSYRAYREFEELKRRYLPN